MLGFSKSCPQCLRLGGGQFCFPPPPIIGKSVGKAPQLNLNLASQMLPSMPCPDTSQPEILQLNPLISKPWNQVPFSRVAPGQRGPREGYAGQNCGPGVVWEEPKNPKHLVLRGSEKIQKTQTHRITSQISKKS